MERGKKMMEAPKEEKKFSCKVCEKTFTSYHALGGHMGRKKPCYKRKTESDNYRNEEPEDLTPESKLEEEVALVDNGKNEELEDLSPGSKEEKKFSCKVCEKTFTSHQALGGHMRERKEPCYKRKMESDNYGNEEPEDLTPESKLEEEIALEDNGKYEELEDLSPGSKVKVVDGFELDLNKMPDYMENDIPESGGEEAARTSEEKEKIEEAAKPEPEDDVSLTDMKTTLYECKKCHRIFESQQAVREHLAGRTSDGTCPQVIESTAVVPRFNCDGYILKSDVVWAKRRRSLF